MLRIFTIYFGAVDTTLSGAPLRLLTGRGNEMSDSRKTTSSWGKVRCVKAPWRQPDQANPDALKAQGMAQRRQQADQLARDQRKFQWYLSTTDFEHGEVAQSASTARSQNKIDGSAS